MILVDPKGCGFAAAITMASAAAGVAQANRRDERRVGE